MEVTETEVMIITAQISFLNWVGLNRFRMLRDGSWKSSKLDKKSIDKVLDKISTGEETVEQLIKGALKLL